VKQKRVVIVILVAFSASLLVLGAFLFLAGPSFNVQWKRTYDTGSGTSLMSASKTSDGGFVMLGWNASVSPFGADILLQKIDAEGNIEWTKVCADANNSFPFSVDGTTDGGYIVSGITGEGFDGDYGPFLLKVDANGNEQWNRTYAGRGYFQGNSVQQTADGGFIMTGYGGVSVIKTYSNGSLQWERRYSSGGINEHGSIVRQSADGGYIVLAVAEFHEFVAVDSYSSYMVSAQGTWLLKIDESGNPLWNRIFFSRKDDIDNILYSVQQTFDGGYVLAGISNRTVVTATTTGHAWVLKLNSNGSTQWSKTYGATDWSHATEVQQTSDGGYIVSILSSWGYSGNHVWLWKMDANGSTVWCKPIGTWFSVYFIRQTSDGNYALVGHGMMDSRHVAILIKVDGSPPLFPLDAVPMIFVTSGSFLIAAIVIGVTPSLVLKTRKRIAHVFRRERRVGEGRKDVLLRSLSNEELVRLAKEIPGCQVDTRNSRDELLRIVKEYFSIEEIKNGL